MPFESFNAPEITPDEEQAKVWSEVKKHFETALSAETQSPVYDDEEQERLREVLGALDENDYSKAFEFFEREISHLKNLYELARDNESAKKAGTPQLFEEEIERLEELRNSLILEEQ